MSARLIPLTPGAAPTIPVQRPVLLIGRHPECDVRIDLPKISRRHCCIAQVYDRLVIRDLGSRNGLRVNGRLVDEVQLKAGDEIAIGPLLYRIEADRPEPEPPPPARPQPVAVEKPPSFPSFPAGHDDGLIPLDF
jgi:predicted component of type VI protein secretion system